MTLFRRVVINICCIILFSHAEDISLTGTVTDKDGSPLPGATVTLASDSTLKDTTDQNGAFTISNLTAVHNGEVLWLPLQKIDDISIKRNRLYFSIASSSGNSILSVFSGDGKRCAHIPLDNMKNGIHTYTLPRLSTGFFMLHITTDRFTATRKLINTGNDIYVSHGGMNVTGISNPSPAAAAQIVDTLIVEKEGLPTAKQPIQSYIKTGIVIVMEPAQPVYVYGATVENTCADCEVPELPDAGQLEKNSKLPDPFKMIDGDRITKKSQWRCRRQEILKQAMKYIYGEKPEPPEEVTGTVTNNKISVHVKDQGKEIDLTADISLPTGGTAPYPAIINVGTGFMSMLTIGENRVKGEGVAIIHYNHQALGREGSDGNINRNQEFTGLFYDIYGGKHSAGLLMAWAWGASRIIDVLQEAGGDIIDYRRLGVTGCSRLAKAAYAIGLFDERIALTLPHETSIAGVPCYRYADANCAENTQNNYNGQLWLSNNFGPFVMNTSQLPIDAHSLIATFAPRGLYIMENPAAAQMCAPGGHVSVLGGTEVYTALGCEENLTYNSNTPGGTGHCTYVDAFTDQLIKNITKFLNHESAETGAITPGTNINKSDWIDWTTPTLEDDTDLYSTE